MNTLKLIISSKQNLVTKYGNDFVKIDKLLQKLVQFDAKRDIDTRVIYIDDANSAAVADVTPIGPVNAKNCKKAVDAIYKKHSPAYIVLFGAPDIIPYQIFDNTVDDGDAEIPSDLPYASDAGFSRNVAGFVGPTRVVGRIPDIPGQPDVAYVKNVIGSIMKFRALSSDSLADYFSITAHIWQRSTQQSLTSIFGNSAALKISPVYMGTSTSTDFQPLIHFYNCHGSPDEPKFYGQQNNEFPEAIDSTHLHGNIKRGTIVAAECCFGAQLYNPLGTFHQQQSIANTYFKNGAIAFMGSTTTAYGPADSQGLADLITQYFIKFILRGYSLGRAMLEARQKFLQDSGPDLDPYELKTVAQFNLLGDPSIQAVKVDEAESKHDTVESRRLSLFNKGVNLKMTMSPSMKIDDNKLSGVAEPDSDLATIFSKSSFSGEEPSYIYSVKSKGAQSRAFAKSLGGDSGEVIYRTYVKKGSWLRDEDCTTEVMVIKQVGRKVMGSRIYHRK